MKASGPENGNWKGGRSVASNGYVLIRVGRDHHLADVRGYAYEHRLVAEEMLGRRLQPGEVVHHRDHDKQNNSPENLEVCPSIGHHLHHQHGSGAKRAPGEPNPRVLCACGCGTAFSRYDDSGRQRAFAPGHNPQPSPTMDAILAFLATAGTATLADIAHATRRPRPVVAQAASRLARRGLIRRVRRGVYASGDAR